MNRKQIVWLGAGVGSVVGGLVPMIWGASELSFSSLLFGTIGAIAGIYIGFKITS